MAIINIQFANPLNVSIQSTDMLYAADPYKDQAGENHYDGMWTATDTRPFPVGIVTDVDHLNQVITVNTGGVAPNNFDPLDDWYYFFGKDKKANMTGVLGYYMEVEYRNYSHMQTEIFATGTEFVESSK